MDKIRVRVNTETVSQLDGKYGSLGDPKLDRGYVMVRIDGYQHAACFTLAEVQVVQ